MTDLVTALGHLGWPGLFGLAVIVWGGCKVLEIILRD
jgi:hypothetical protein